MGGYLWTEATYTVADYHPDGIQWQQGTLVIKVNEYGTLAWTLTMTNGPKVNEKHIGRAVGLYLSINENLIYNSYTNYYPDSNTPKWSTFPTGYNTSASGSFTVGSASFNVTLGISCMQGNVSVYGRTISETFYRNYWDNITNGSPPVIVDNGNNTFSITGYKGNDAYNNAVTKSQLEWTVQSITKQNYYGWLEENGGYFRSDFTETEKKLDLSFSDIDRDYGGSYPTDRATRTVAATVINYDSYGQYTSNSYVYGEIKQYFWPSPPGKPELTDDSFKNKRLTLKKNWTFTWTAAKPANDSSLVKGYRIRLYKNLDKSNYEQIKIVDNSAADSYYDTDQLTQGYNQLVEGATYSNLSFTIDPNKFGFEPGDSVRLMIYSYTRNGNGTLLFNNDGDADKGVISDDYPIVNSGVLRIRDSNTWKEGQVYVYEGTWKEASTVYVRNNNEWKEST